MLLQSYHTTIIFYMAAPVFIYVSALYRYYCIFM